MAVTTSSFFINVRNSFIRLIYFPAILFIISSAAGLSKSFNHPGAMPIAKIPPTNSMAASFSFQLASFNCKCSWFIIGPIATFPIALKIYTAVTTIDIAAAMVAISVLEIPVFEYEPNKIKKAITGAGHADKDQIYKMVKLLLPAANPKTPDESDAIAIALAHSNMSKFKI